MKRQQITCRYLSFVAINTLTTLVIFLWAIEIDPVRLGHQDGAFERALLIGPCISLLLIYAGLYLALRRAVNWWQYVAWFYIAFILFCFSLNFLDVANLASANTDAFLGWLVRGFFIIMAGHFYGVIYLPFIIGMNYLLKTYFFQSSSHK